MNQKEYNKLIIKKISSQKEINKYLENIFFLSVHRYGFKYKGVKKNELGLMPSEKDIQKFNKSMWVEKSFLWFKWKVFEPKIESLYLADTLPKTYKILVMKK
jgi:hypothetical protein